MFPALPVLPVGIVLRKLMTNYSFSPALTTQLKGGGEELESTQRHLATALVISSFPVVGVKWTLIVPWTLTSLMTNTRLK